MRTLYLDCGMGAAGDMLAAALLELVPEQEAVLAELNSLGIPGVCIRQVPALKCGIKGTRMIVEINGQEENTLTWPNHEHQHEHTHEHDPEHTIDNAADTDDHQHMSLADIVDMITSLKIPDDVKNDALAVYQLIAEAECQIHGTALHGVHFHEVGAMDAVADIVTVCMLMHRIAPQQIFASAVHVGSGHVRCSHGILPVPAPATAQILQGVPVYGGGVRGELCTPTGAALLKHFVIRFGELPLMQINTVGYGMGKKDFEAANCVRALLGESADAAAQAIELSCNLDDMTPEAIGFASDRLFAAGALDVYTIPVGMKKSRPGILLCVTCREADRDLLVNLLFKHTTTLGIRESKCRRHMLSRATTSIETPYGTVRRKDAVGYNVNKTKYEYDDIARIAVTYDMSLYEVTKSIDDRSPNEPE